MESTKRYVGALVNSQRCTFDTIKSDSIKKIKSWAKNRGGVYTLTITDSRLHTAEYIVGCNCRLINVY